MPFESVVELPQSVRNSICTRLLKLTLTELFVWSYMQTDPNMGNYLYDADTDKVCVSVHANGRGREWEGWLVGERASDWVSE